MGYDDSTETTAEECSLINNTAPATETTYQKFVRERDNDENNNAILTGLSQRMFDAEGNPYDVIYKDGETLDFFATVDGKEIQVLFLSPCYSKEYPLYTKVTFRQIQ